MKNPALLLTAALLFSPIAFAQQSGDHMAAPTPHNGEKPGDAMPMHAPVPPSKSLTVTFEGHTTTFTVEDLLKLPQVTVHVHNEHRNADEEYTGPLVSDVLAKAGLTSTRETQPLILHSTVVATGTDKYFVVYSAAELEPGFTTGQSIIAVMKHDLPNTEGGLIQLINANAAKPARWIHGLMSLSVMSLQQTQ